MSEEVRLPIDQGKSHLSIMLDAPEKPAIGNVCLLFLHGFGSVQLGTKATFFRERAIEAGIPFCSFDFQGHGQSGGSMRTLTMTRNLADIECVRAFLEERGYFRVVLIGSSMGGYAGLWYAARHPERVVAACHIAPGFKMSRGFLLWAGSERAREWQQSGLLRFQNEDVDVEIGWGWIEDLRQFDDDRLATHTRTPTLIFHGRHDKSIPWRQSVEFVRTCDSDEVELHVFAGGDHRLTDWKDRMWALMVEFLSARGVLGG